MKSGRNREIKTRSGYNKNLKIIRKEGCKMENNTLKNALEMASKESSSLKKLLELQTAYIEAVNLFQKDQISLSLRNAAEYAVKHFAIEMAKKGDVDQEVITAMETDTCFNWHEITYILLEHMPRMAELVNKYL